MASLGDQIFYEYVDKLDTSVICPICHQAATEPLSHIPFNVQCNRLICKRCKELSEAKGANCAFRSKKPSLLSP